MTPEPEQPSGTPDAPPWGTPGDPPVPGLTVEEAPPAGSVADEGPPEDPVTAGPPRTGPGDEAPSPGPRQPDLLLGTAVALVVLLVGVLATVLLARSGDGTRGAASTVAAWPTVGPESPTTPAGQMPWAGTVPAPSPTAGQWSAAAEDAVPTGVGVTTGVATGEPAPFCLAARQGLATVGGQGLEMLEALATRVDDAAPQARALVASALDQVDRLRGSAPEALTEAVGVLQQAWHRLASELEDAGYGRGELALLSVRYLTDPVVAAATETVARWTAERCGVDLLGVHSGSG